MSGANDLDKLLRQLKDEVGPLPPEPQPQPPARPAPAEPGAPRWQAQPPRTERFMRPRVDGRPQPGMGQGGGNLSWSENKEAMLFGMLASLVLVLGGVLAGLDYLVLIGAVVFMMFAFMMLLALFGYYLNFRRVGRPDKSGLAERLETLSRKVDSLGGVRSSGPAAQYQGAPSERERELERKVEELRVIVKTLARGRENAG